ncbi:MAG: spore cortex biosynthesis protein YabQ, partial [Lachnospiraceae bacterium]
MKISAEILKEADVLLISLVMGMAMLFVYDLLRIIRRLIRHGSIMLGMEDLIFWIVSAISLFAMLYQENSGYIRGFVIGGVLLGMLLYNVLISHWVVKFSVFIMKKIFFIVSRPFAWLWMGFRKPIGYIKRSM